MACWTAYVRQELHEHIAKAPPANPITMVTLTAAFVLFVVVFIATPRGLGVRLSSAVIAAMAAPMIFELPFDLFLVELITLSLLAVSPMVKLSRPAFFCLALMLLVFAVWALAGFGYPSAPIPIAMNVVSKILAFVTALSLFFPEWFTRWRRSQPDPGIEQAADASELQPQSA